jgi:hypothetical protein
MIWCFLVMWRWADQKATEPTIRPIKNICLTFIPALQAPPYTHPRSAAGVYRETFVCRRGRVLSFSSRPCGGKRKRCEPPQPSAVVKSFPLRLVPAVGLGPPCKRSGCQQPAVQRNRSASEGAGRAPKNALLAAPRRSQSTILPEASFGAALRNEFASRGAGPLARTLLAVRTSRRQNFACRSGAEWVAWRNTDGKWRHAC